MKKLIFVIILTTVLSVYGQTDEKAALEQTNQRVISLYRGGKFDDALKFAQQVVESSLKVYGSESRDTAAAYLNLGLIYREKKKLKEAVENLQKSADIYQKLPDFEAKEIVSVYEKLAQAQFLDKKIQDAEAGQLKAVEIIEGKFGKESRESYPAILSLANFYSRSGNPERANEIYLKSYTLSIKYFGKDSQEVERIGELKFCSALNSPKTKSSGDDAKENYKKFAAARNAILGYEPELSIINIKASSMVSPTYPTEAKSQRISGPVAVKVKIDEQGNVSEAKIVCGHPIFKESVEEAARKSKFRPELKDGKPIKFGGFIVFNYVGAGF